MTASLPTAPHNPSIPCLECIPVAIRSRASRHLGTSTLFNRSPPTLSMNPTDPRTETRVARHLTTYPPVIFVVRSPVNIRPLGTILSASFPCTQSKTIGARFRRWVAEILTCHKLLTKILQEHGLVASSCPNPEVIFSGLLQVVTSTPLSHPLRLLMKHIPVSSSALRREGGTDHSIGLYQ